MDNTQIEIANQSGNLEKELSLREISQMFLRNWPLFLVLFFVFNLSGVIYYKYFNPYVSRATIILNDAQNSQLQSYAQGQQGFSVKTNEAKKTNSTINKRLDYFNTRAFYDDLLVDILNINTKTLTVKESLGLSYIKQNLLNNKTTFSYDDRTHIFKFFENSIHHKVKADYELEITVSHDQKEVALFISNLVSKKILENFKNKEIEEITTVKNQLLTEKNSIDQELSDISKKMSGFSAQPEALISIGSKEKVSDYLTDLMQRKSEAKIRIAENERIINELRQNSSKQNLKKESVLYGNGGKVQALALENEMLKAKLQQLQNTINEVTLKAKNLPYLSQIYDDLKKRSDIQLARLKDINESISKSDLSLLAASHKYEIYESPRFEKVKPLVSLTIVLFLAVLATQIIGSIIIYLRAIWDTNIITAESTRNVVVVDSHSLDPRVIIENSKIRFRLRNSTIDGQDPQFVKSKNIGFGLSKSIHDDAQSASEEG